jgi:hypothetical protein
MRVCVYEYFGRLLHDTRKSVGWKLRLTRMHELLLLFESYTCLYVDESKLYHYCRILRSLALDPCFARFLTMENVRHLVCSRIIHDVVLIGRPRARDRMRGKRLEGDAPCGVGWKRKRAYGDGMAENGDAGLELT